MILRFLAALFHKETPSERLLREAFEGAEEHRRKVNEICAENFRKKMDDYDRRSEPEQQKKGDKP